MSDTEIKEGLLRNDEETIRYVFYEHFNTLLHFNAQKATWGKGVEYEDLIQELFVYINRDNWEKLQMYSTEYSFSSWFSVVSYRFFKDYTRSMIDTAQNLPIDEMNEASLCMIGVEGVEPVETSRDIKELIGNLTPLRYREVLTAILINGEDLKEVAKRIHVTVDNLYNIIRRAKAKLIDQLLSELNHQR